MGMLHIIHGQVLVLTESREQLPGAAASVQAWEENIQSVEDVLGEIAPGEKARAEREPAEASIAGSAS